MVKGIVVLLVGVLVCIIGIQDYIQAVDEPARMLSTTLSLSGFILFVAGIYKIIRSKKKWIRDIHISSLGLFVHLFQ